MSSSDGLKSICVVVSVFALLLLAAYFENFVDEDNLIAQEIPYFDPNDLELFDKFIASGGFEHLVPKIRREIPSYPVDVLRKGSNQQTCARIALYQHRKRLADGGALGSKAILYSEMILMGSEEIRFANFPLDGGASSKIHIISFYEKMKPWYFCVLESIVKTLMFNSLIEKQPAGGIHSFDDFIKNSHFHNYSREDLPNPLPRVEVFVWTLDFLDLIEDETIVEVAKSLKDVVDKIPREEREVAIRFKKMTEEQGFFGTPLGEFFACAEANNALIDLGPDNFVAINKADGLRLAMVYKFGGIYFDDDYIAINDPTLIPPGLSKAYLNYVNNAAMKFSKRDQFLELCLAHYVKNYIGELWANEGPKLLQAVLRQFCPDATSGDRDKNVGPYVIHCRNHQTPSNDFDFTINHWGYEVAYDLIGEPTHIRRSAKFVWDKNKDAFLNPKRISLLHLTHTSTHRAEIAKCKEGIDSYMSTFRGKLRYGYCPSVMKVIDERGRCDFE